MLTSSVTVTICVTALTWPQNGCSVPCIVPAYCFAGRMGPALSSDLAVALRRACLDTRARPALAHGTAVSLGPRRPSVQAPAASSAPALTRTLGLLPSCAAVPVCPAAHLGPVPAPCATPSGLLGGRPAAGPRLPGHHAPRLGSRPRAEPSGPRAGAGVASVTGTVSLPDTDSALPGDSRLGRTAWAWTVGPSLPDTCASRLRGLSGRRVLSSGFPYWQSAA